MWRLPCNRMRCSNSKFIGGERQRMHGKARTTHMLRMRPPIVFVSVGTLAQYSDKVLEQWLLHGVFTQGYCLHRRRSPILAFIILRGFRNPHRQDDARSKTDCSYHAGWYREQSPVSPLISTILPQTSVDPIAARLVNTAIMPIPMGTTSRPTTSGIRLWLSGAAN